MTTQQIKSNVVAILNEQLPHATVLSPELVNELANLVTTCQDELDILVDELKRMQRELERHHRYFYAVFDDASLGYALCNEEGYVFRANNTLINMLKCDSSDLLRHPFSDFIENTSLVGFETFLRLFKLNKEETSIDIALISGKNNIPVTVKVTMYKDTHESFIRFSVSNTC